MSNGQFCYNLFRREDWDGFFALFQNNLANFALIAIVMLGMDFPPEIVFGYVIPGAAIAVLAGNLYYAWMARRLARKENRNNVTALSYGISTPPMFVFLYGILNVALEMTGGDHRLAWKLAVGAALLGGVIEMFGAIIGPWLRRNLPRAAMLGAIAGVAISFMTVELLAETMAMPVIGFVVLGIIVVGLIADTTMPFQIPTSILALVVGTVLAYGLGRADLAGVEEYLERLSFYPLRPTLAAFGGLSELFTTFSALLATLIPIEIYNLIETMNNVEAVSALGDDYNVRECMLVDGAGTALGSLFGGCFPTTVYIASAGAKEMKAGAGYSIGNGVALALLAFSGGIALVSELIPLPVIAPILVYVGVIMVTNAFMTSPHRHAPAVVVASIPYIFNYLVSNFEFATADYPALEQLAAGALVTGLVWGALVCFVIDRRWLHAVFTGIIGYLLAAVGFIHNEEIGLYLLEEFSLMYLGWTLLMLFFLIYYHYKPEAEGSYSPCYLQESESTSK